MYSKHTCFFSVPVVFIPIHTCIYLYVYIHIYIHTQTHVHLCGPYCVKGHIHSAELKISTESKKF